MGSHNEVGESEQGIILLWRFLFEDVEGGALYLAALQRLHQRLLFDDAAARAVDQANARLKFREGLGVEHVFGGVVERNMDANVVGLRVDLIQSRQTDIEILGVFLGS